MADWDGYLDTAFEYQLTSRYNIDQSTNVETARPIPPQTVIGIVTPDPALSAGTFEATGEGLEEKRDLADFEGYLMPGPHEFWFEILHAKPQTIELGNLLSTAVRDIEIYNAWREAARSLTAAVPNAGPGVTFQNLPGLPYDIPSQNSLDFQVRITTDGPPTIDGTLDFTLDVQGLSIPITGNRTISFAFEAESPIQEILEFATTNLEAVSGDEQRYSVRKKPRQVLSFKVKLETGTQRRLMQSLLFGFQPGTFGLPIWYEARRLASDITATDTTIYLDTAYADFRVDGLAMIWGDEDQNEVLEIDSLTATSLTFSSAVSSDYDADTTLIMPLRVGIAEALIPVGRHPVNLDEIDFRFTTLDNDSDFESTSAFNTYNSKVMLDDPNAMGTTIRNDFVRKMGRLDNISGVPLSYSDWVGARYATTKGFVCNSPQEIWEARQLVHALHGSLTTFYLPTFYKDIKVVDTLASGSVLMDIELMGYSDLIAQNEPNASVWIELNDGTIITREVVDSEVHSETVERLTVDTVWASTVQAADINRVSFLQLCRIADDEVMFLHTYSGSARVQMNVLAVKS